MDKITLEKRSEGSVKRICEAMFKKLKEKPFEEITITEICEEAELARKTFYRNFVSKEDVIKISIDRLMQEFAKDIEINGLDFDAKKLALEYFNFWYSKREFLTLMFNNDLFSILNSQYEIYMRVFRKLLKGEETIDTELEYILIFVAGGYWNILQHWVRKGFVDTPDELATIWAKRIEKVKEFI